jgi:hypothetical protein
MLFKKMEDISFKFYDELIDLFEKHFDNIINELDSLDRIEALEEKINFYRELKILLRKYQTK